MGRRGAGAGELVSRLDGAELTHAIRAAGSLVAQGALLTVDGVSMAHAVLDLAEERDALRVELTPPMACGHLPRERHPSGYCDACHIREEADRAALLLDVANEQIGEVRSITCAAPTEITALAVRRVVAERDALRAQLAALMQLRRTPEHGTTDEEEAEVSG